MSLAQVPGLAVVLVGTRGDSETYVRSKRRACEEVGIQSFATDLPEDVLEDDLLQVWRIALQTTMQGTYHLKHSAALLRAGQCLHELSCLVSNLLVVMGYLVTAFALKLFFWETCQT